MIHLRTKVFIQILIPTAIIFFVIVLTSLYIINESYKEQNITKKTLEIETASRAINDWLISRLSEMILISRTNTLKNRDMAEIISFLDAEQDRLSFIYNKMWFIEKDGQYWNTDDETGTFENMELINDLILVERLFKYIAPVTIGSDTDKPVVFIAVPIYQDNELKAILGSTVLISWFNWVISYFTYNIFDEVLLVNPDGKVITHTNADLIGLNEIDIYNHVFTKNTEFNNNLVFIAILRNTWKIVGIINKQIFYTTLDTINTLIILIAFVIFLIIGVISTWISKTVAKPINSLTSMVKRMMQGDFNQEIIIKSNDEIKALASAFNHLNKRLMQMRTDDRFIFLGHLSARMAHEIRKPLNIIQLAAQSLKKELKSNTKNTKIIINEVSNADKFIKEILDFTKSDVLNLVYYSINNLIKKVVEKYSLLAANLNKKIKIKINKNNPNIKFYFDILKMEQVFSNILENALESVKDGGEILVSVSYDNERTVIEFSDSGSGFNSKHVDKVFDPYFTTKKNGTGMGLSICYRILMSHGAKIEATNKKSGGARIRITFPISK